MGTHKKYDNNELLSAKIDDYFATSKQILSITGLCNYLGICRDTLCEYEKLEIFSDTVKIAKQKIEQFVEEQALLGKLNPAVSIFNLKNNFGWKDTQHIEQQGTLTIQSYEQSLLEYKRKKGELPEGNIIEAECKEVDE